MDQRAYKRTLAKGIGKLEKKIKKEKHKCLIPDCSKTAIRSHSQQKEKQLRSIATDGCVYAMQRSIYQSIKNPDEPLIISKQGLSEASTFPGFCEKHDKDLFHPIDNSQIAENSEQAFLIFMRSFCYEIAQKRRGLKWMNGLIELLETLGNNNLREVEIMRDGIKHFTELDSVYYLDRLWAAYCSRNFEIVETKWITANKNIGISSSCIFTPHVNAHELYENYMCKGKPQPLLSFNVIPEQQKSHIVISWFKEHAELTSWIKDRICSNDSIEEFVNYGAFAESEDTCISPVVWESLSDEKKLSIKESMRHELWRSELDKIPMIVSV